MSIQREEVVNLSFSDVTDPAGEVLDSVTPGDILLHDFMEPLGFSANALARALKVPANRITGIVNGGRGMTADTALRLERYFAMPAVFWLNLQKQHELEVATRKLKNRILAEVAPRAA